MRLPVVPNVSTKDGQSNKNARLTNCLKESTKRGDKAVVRPGLVDVASGSGVGGGLVAFDNDLVSVYGTTLGKGAEASTSVSDLGVPDASPVGGSMGNSGSLLLVVEAVGPTVKTSTDGITFTTVNTTDALYFPFYALGYFFAFNAAFTDLYRSDDSGVTWTVIATLPAYSWTASEVKVGTINLIAFDYLGTSYRISSSDYGVTWSAPVAIADLTSLGPGGWATTMDSTGLSFLPCYGSTPAKVISSSDSFSSYSVVRSIDPFSTADFPNTAYANGKLYFVERDVTGNSLYLYESTDGVTFDAGTLLYTDPVALDAIGCFTFNGELHVYYSGDSDTALLLYSYDGVIPSLATVPTGLYDFAQSST